MFILYFDTLYFIGDDGAVGPPGYSGPKGQPGKAADVWGGSGSGNVHGAKPHH